MPELPMSRERILGLMSGFRTSCVIGAAAELDLWTTLGDQCLSAIELAERLGCDRRAVTILLDAVAALGLLEKQDERYCVPEPLRGWLAADSEKTILPMLQHMGNLLRGWSQLGLVAKTGKPTARAPSIRGPEADRASFIAAMHSISGPMADDLVKRLGPLGFKHLLDVGGASGTWTLAFLRAAPSATATIFDLPDAIEQARERLAGTGLARRVTLVPGDFYANELPGNADFAWISAICHQHSRERNRELFRKVFAAIKPGGRIAIRDIVMAESRTEPLEGALFAINMLVNTESGGTFTLDEYAADLRAVGFQNPRLVIKDEAMSSVVAAEKR
ncbi:MAG: acetylserotonin O-methyltransferase [Planctomycetaceae bacterium]|nr:acetylserotonin O-methyltransferase [Planctomycetaceae bacterium]